MEKMFFLAYTAEIQQKSHPMGAGIGFNPRPPWPPQDKGFSWWMDGFRTLTWQSLMPLPLIWNFTRTKENVSSNLTVENFSSISRVTAVGGYFQMSLTSHLTFQKLSCRRRCIMCERPRYVGLLRVGGGCNAFGAWNISSLKGRGENSGPATAEISRIGLPALAHLPENCDSTVAAWMSVQSVPRWASPQNALDYLYCACGFFDYF